MVTQSYFCCELCSPKVHPQNHIQSEMSYLRSSSAFTSKVDTDCCMVSSRTTFFVLLWLHIPSSFSFLHRSPFLHFCWTLWSFSIQKHSVLIYVHHWMISNLLSPQYSPNKHTTPDKLLTIVCKILASPEDFGSSSLLCLKLTLQCSSFFPAYFNFVHATFVVCSLGLLSTLLGELLGPRLAHLCHSIQLLSLYVFFVHGISKRCITIIMLVLVSQFCRLHSHTLD